MELAEAVGDHPKEYYYKTSSSGSILYYHRTANGHKRIAKSKIPSRFVNEVKEYNTVSDQSDWLRYIADGNKKIQQYRDQIRGYECMVPVPTFYAKSKQILDDRISSIEKANKRYIEYNAKASQERYKEETRPYGGFKGYFKAKYGGSKFIAPRKIPNNYRTLLKEEGIIDYDNASDDNKINKADAKKRYRRWLVSNHPDKGGSDEVCAMVIAAYKKMFE